MNNQRFDGKLITTIILTFVVFVGYQMYLKKKYPEMDKATEKTEVLKESKSENKDTKKQATSPDTKIKLIPETELKLEDETWTVLFSSRGLGVKDVILKNHSDREGKPIQFLPINGQLNFETNLVGSEVPLVFAMNKVSDKQVTGEARSQGMKIIKTVTLDPSQHKLETYILVENVSDNFVGITTLMSSPVHPNKGSGFLPLPSFEHQEFYAAIPDDFERHVLSGKEQSKALAQTSLVGLSSQYFAMALKNQSDVIPKLDWKFTPHESADGTTTAIVTHTMLNKQPNFTVRYFGYAGPKGYNQLASVDPELTGLVDFGFFNTLAVWIYRLLQKIHSLIGNWGLAIIALTALVRLLVMPFNVMSYKSMRVMSKIQPQVKAAQAKYKDDKVKANEEVMKLMKENKANPLGGCLPMLVQIPVFFALYRVLGQSVELYKAPFYFWITDLSAKDPFFIIPVLMTATMFMQQKLTPSTMEPAQQRIMMFMLLGFSIFFITLPAGLTLYMFVSTLFGVLQQQYFLKEKKAAA